jgi:hypothetical protein
MSRRRSKRKRVSDAVRETLKRTHILEENEVDDSNEDVFFMPLNNPIYLKPAIIEPTFLTLHCHNTPSRSRRLLNLHEKIVEELLDPQLLGYPARQCTPSSKPCSIPILVGLRCKLSKFAMPIGLRC